jgi:hypothetical protein
VKKSKRQSKKKNRDGGKGRRRRMKVLTAVKRYSSSTLSCRSGTTSGTPPSGTWKVRLSNSASCLACSSALEASFSLFHFIFSCHSFSNLSKMANRLFAFEHHICICMWLLLSDMHTMRNIILKTFQKENNNNNNSTDIYVCKTIQGVRILQ